MGPHGTAKFPGVLIMYLVGWPIIRCSVTLAVNTPSLMVLESVCLVHGYLTTLNQLRVIRVIRKFPFNPLKAKNNRHDIY